MNNRVDSMVPDRSNLTENAALNVFLKHSALHSLRIPLAFLFAFPKHSSNAFPVGLLLSSTVPFNVSYSSWKKLSIYWKKK